MRHSTDKGSGGHGQADQWQPSHSEQQPGQEEGTAARSGEAGPAQPLVGQPPFAQ
jgi:hypothetical protein